MFCHQPGAVQVLLGSGGIYDAASLVLKSLNSFGHGFLGDLSQDNPIKGNFQQK